MKEGSPSARVIIFIGPPGSGKDTQAGLLVEEYGYMQIPSSQIIKKKFADNPEDPVIVREKEIFDAGKLNSPELVANWIMEFVRPLAEAGDGVIFSGSPRTPQEAEVEIAELAQVYGLERIIVIRFSLDEVAAKERTTTRRICRANGHPFPNGPEFATLKNCPKDGSELYTRALDNPDKFAVRMQEYRTLTEPSVPVLEKAGLVIHDIDASRSIEAIHQDVVALLERGEDPVPAE